MICDFAETYNIYNYRELPLDLLATLCFGLRPNSRVKMKLTEATVDIDTMLLASIVDRVSMLVWMQSDDGRKNQNRPPSITNTLIESAKPKQYAEFRTAEDFERMRHNLMCGE